LKLVEDLKTLKDMGIQDGSVIKEGKELGYKSADESELRNNIQKNKDMSYYYAHATETPLPENLRYVSGGDPIPLNSPGDAKSNLPDTHGLAGGERSNLDALEKPKSVAPVVPKKNIVNYSWCDADEFAKVYITQKEVMEIVKRAKAVSKDALDKAIEVVYEEKTVTFNVRDFKDDACEVVKTHYVLILKLQNEIEPENCKQWKTSDSKVTLTLAKVNKQTKWYALV